VRILRICLTYWFFLSDSLLVCGCVVVLRFCLICNFSAIDLLKCDVNHGLQSLMIFWGNLNHWKTCSKYSCAISGLVIVVLQGKKIAVHEHPWSTMVRIASFPP
jgi:hypothetical protein